MPAGEDTERSASVCFALVAVEKWLSCSVVSQQSQMQFGQFELLADC